MYKTWSVNKISVDGDCVLIGNAWKNKINQKIHKTFFWGGIAI